MKIKRVLSVGGVALILLVGVAYHYLFGFVVSEQLDDNVTVIMRKNILSQIGANVLVFSSAGETLLVDTQLPPLAASTRSNVDAISLQQPNQVLITHWHPDHSGGISAFSDDTEVIAHRNVTRRLSAPQEGFGLTKPGSHHNFAARTAAELPTKAIDGRLELAIGTATATVVHYPEAHTDGDLVIFFHESRLAAIGDLVWPGSFPFIDVHNGGSVTGLEAALEGLINEATADYRFVPGHGAALTVDDIIEYLEVIRQTRRWVESRLIEGQSLDQIVDSGLPEKWDHWSSPLVPSSAWIKMIFNSRVSSKSQALTFRQTLGTINT